MPRRLTKNRSYQPQPRPEFRLAVLIDAERQTLRVGFIESARPGESPAFRRPEGQTHYAFLEGKAEELRHRAGW